MACPFFMPTERLTAELWPHRARLPLGDGYRGLCMAAGQAAQPSDDELRDFCNLGYAKGCPKLPRERHADAVRFIVTHDRDDRVGLYYTAEREHAPRDHGALTFERSQQRWLATHPDPRVQRMAECYLQSYFARKSTT